MKICDPKDGSVRNCNHGNPDSCVPRYAGLTYGQSRPFTYGSEDQMWIETVTGIKITPWHLASIIDSMQAGKREGRLVDGTQWRLTTSQKI